MIIDVKTRCNLAYVMFSRVLRLQSAVEKFSSWLDCKKIPLSEIKWDQLEKMCNFLKPLWEAINKMCETRLPAWQLLYSWLKQQCVSSGCDLMVLPKGKRKGKNYSNVPRNEMKEEKREEWCLAGSGWRWCVWGSSCLHIWEFCISMYSLFTFTIFHHVLVLHRLSPTREADGTIVPRDFFLLLSWK